MSEQNNRQPISKEQYLFFLSIGYMYEGPVEGGYALRSYDAVSIAIDDYGRKYMMNAVNPVFVSDNTRVAGHKVTGGYTYQRHYEQRKQQIKDDFKRLISQYYTDEIAKEKAKKDIDALKLTGLESAAYWLPQKVQEERLSTAELSNQLLNSTECKIYLDMIGDKELWSWDKIGEIKKYEPNFAERFKEEVPIIGNLIYSMGDDVFITLQVILLQTDRYHLSGHMTEGQEVLEAGIGTITQIAFPQLFKFKFPLNKFLKFKPIKPLNFSQWRKLHKFTKQVKGKEVQFMYKQQYINTIQKNNLILKDIEYLEKCSDIISIGIESFNYIDNMDK